jgi:hypothetical protein
VKLREHDVVLRGERVVLRPMTEGDWDALFKWNSDALDAPSRTIILVAARAI